MTSDKVLLSLVKSGIGNASDQLPPEVDWQEVHSRAKRHGVIAIAMDGIVLSGQNLPRDIMRLWMTDTVKIETSYAKGVRVIEELASEYGQAGIPLMIVKGFGLSQYYPVPDHRPTGDIDIWNFGFQREADKFLSDKNGLVIDNGVHHHSVFRYRGMTVENHYDFLNVHSHRSNARIEKLLKAMVAVPEQCARYARIENVYLPPVEFNALYLLRHMAAHFSAEKVNLRHVLDWGTFVRVCHDKIDWTSLLERVRAFNMDKFLGCIDAICVDDLGFDSTMFPDLPVDHSLKSRVLDDILNIHSTVPQRGLSHIGQRFRRWLNNSWKHKIVYNESLTETFLAQIAAHLMKPASFNH